MTIVRFENVTFSYNGHEVLRDVSFDVFPGEFVGLIGPNGSGKTTLLKLASGLLCPGSGRVLAKDVPVSRMKRRDVARTMAVVPQEQSLLFPFLVQEMVFMGRTPHLGLWPFERPKDYTVVQNAMALTNTLHLADRPMDRLSGGERQRVLIARALAQEPELMLLDEPTAFLDIRHQVEFFDMMKDLNQTHGMTVLAVTHDINLASLYCDRLILLKQGRIHSMGCPEDVIREDHVQAVYGIPVFVDRHPVIGVPRVTPKRGHPLGEE